ncbi:MULTISPECIES: paraquat-inducible protein A [Methylophaga]|uniref:Paraquat-inducible protein A n=1 Tax=Methylophaga marina TaxID=45495 RepID=A0ABP3DJ06_9GAMM|nr:paraquat-inducible protein A [Methylophaga marina]BDZ73642.1 paraquat-inducible protein A [Methylophaga marina]
MKQAVSFQKLDKNINGQRRLRACHECDWVSALPRLRPGEVAHCPRCHHVLARRHYRPAQRSLAIAISAFIALLIAVSFPFVSFSIKGIGHSIEIEQTASMLLSFEQPIVAIVVALTIIILPAMYLVSVIWLQLVLLFSEPKIKHRQIARTLKHLDSWMMADVFIIGALVSLFKIAGMADIELGIAFWAYAVFAFLLLMTTRSIDADWMWFAIAGEPRAPAHTNTGQGAAEQGLTGCPTCGLIHALDKGSDNHCLRCGEPLHARAPKSLQRTLALLITATIFYIPANVYPIMTTTNFGQEKNSTIMAGVIDLIEHGSWPIALVIFIASILVPIAKLIVLSWLCLTVNNAHQLSQLARLKLYRITEFIGRWSMVDVFVVAILVALIHAGDLISVTPGPAALAFASVVVLTMLAAITFDSRLIWDKPQTELRPAQDNSV